MSLSLIAPAVFPSQVPGSQGSRICTPQFNAKPLFLFGNFFYC
jgi:hypothetical protein